MSDLFKNLLITDYYKYLLYIFGLIFIGSIFLPVYLLNQEKIFFFSLISIVYWCMIWAANSWIKDLRSDAKFTKNFDEKRSKITNWRAIVHIGGLVAYLLIALYFLTQN